MPDVTAAQAPGLSGDQIDRILQAMAESFGQQLRSPILHSPSEESLDYQDVTFPALDGVPLEGWFIPAAGSGKLIIANHPMGFSRSGIPTHLEPWRSVWASSGNDFEINLVPDYKILHDAGYDVLAYDLRNFGHSGAANGGIASSGIFEARDVAGSLNYARSRHDDALTDPGDVRTMFDSIPVADKKLLWIHGTTRRWDGYLEFQRRPRPMLEWFEKHIS
jgi:hypothetical protein